jgi:metallo-beta-lactamase family protein
MNTPRVTFWGGVGSVTGANFLVESGETKFLVDCGLFQGVPESREVNKEEFPYEVTDIQALFITHAHIDHIGRVPKLVAAGFSGTVYSTPETKALSELMLVDAAHIMANDARDKNIKPLYTSDDVSKSLNQWKTISYHVDTVISPSVSVRLLDAGHILGSSMYLFTLTTDGAMRTILFTGDLGNSPSRLLPDTEYVNNVNYVVMDSVYGDRNHEPKEEREEKFKALLLDSINRKGVVLIPAFSLERTQSILYEINNLIEEKQIPSVPVFLDSPLAIRLTKIYEKIVSLYNSDVQKDIHGGDDIYNFPKLKMTAKSDDSRRIHLTPDPKIIIAGSGMSTAGRILHHEAMYLPDPNATLLLMGYQAAGSLGRELQDGAKVVTIRDQQVQVKARVITIGGYSAHKDSDHLIDFIDHVDHKNLRKVFVVMGEPKASLFLTQRLHDYLNVDAIAPERGKVYELK